MTGEATMPRTDQADGEAPTGGEALVDRLTAHDVDTLFLVPGIQLDWAVDALARTPSIRCVVPRHEQTVTYMADGYARASGEVGVAIATSGPGATNLVTGLATAMLDSIPMVCITGQVPSHLLGTDAFQETDITGVTPVSYTHPTLPTILRV